MKKQRLILGLTGETGVGKTTLGNYLTMAYGFTHIAFADLNRQEVADNWGFDVRWFDAYPFKDTAQDWLCVANCKDANFLEWFGKQPGEFYHYEACAPRRLQIMWADYMKSTNGEDYYVRAVEKIITQASDKNFVVSDVRTELEAEFIHKLGFDRPFDTSAYVIRIKGFQPSAPKINHPMHTPLANDYVNFEIENQWDQHLFADWAEHTLCRKAAGFKAVAVTRRNRLDGCIQNLE